MVLLSHFQLLKFGANQKFKNMKFSDALRFLGLGSGLLGALLILGGVIGFFIGDEFLGVRNFYNWFYIANSFLFLGIFCFVMKLNCKKDEDKASV